MGRIRTVKPEFWTSEDVAELSWDARLVWIGLWNYADDNGVGRDNIKLIVAELFPLEKDPIETLARVSRALDELAEQGRITRYTANGRPFLAIVGWKHQRIDRPSKARYPRPEQVEQTPRNPGPPSSPDPVLDAPSRESREPVASPRETPSPGAGIREQVPGSREQGSREQGNRDQGSLAPTSGAGEATAAGDGEALFDPPPPPPPAAPPARPARPAKLPSGVRTLTQREPDPIWDALLAACRIPPDAITSSQRGAVNRAVKELREVGATPEQVAARARRWAVIYPNANLTPSGLARHWGSLASNAAEPRHASSGGW